MESTPARLGVLASIWRPNRLTASLLFSVKAACKCLIFLAWGARGPEFKSRCGFRAKWGTDSNRSGALIPIEVGRDSGGKWGTL